MFRIMLCHIYSQSFKSIYMVLLIIISQRATLIQALGLHLQPFDKPAASRSDKLR